MIPTQALLYWREHRYNDIAVEIQDRRYSWGRLAAHVALLVDTLEREGLQPGALLGVQCGDRYLNLVLILAAEAAGVTHATLSADELVAADVIASTCAVLLVERPTAPLRDGQKIIQLDGAWMTAALERSVDSAKLQRLAAPGRATAPVRIGRTSGTTGSPKVMLAKRRLVDACLTVFDQVYPAVGPANCFLCCYPLTIRSIYMEVMRALMRGARVRFLPIEAFHHLAQPGSCWTWLLASTAERLASGFAARRSFLGLSFIKFAGTRMTPAMHDLLSMTLSASLFNPYSSNEANTVAMLPAHGPGTVAPGMEVMICDEAMRPLPSGEAGFIAVRGPRVIDGYVGDPGLTARQFRDGWFLMNDFGRMPSEGQLEVIGRADDILDLRGVKLMPYASEHALRRLPWVRDAALLHRHDALGIGQLQVALETTAAPDAASIRTAVRMCLPEGVAPFSVFCLAGFPRTVTGKLRRTELAIQLSRLVPIL